MRKIAPFKLILMVLGLLTVGGESFVANEVMALVSFKEAIYDDPSLVLASWNGLDSDPCGWPGVSCTPGGDHVVKLNVSGSSLKGFVAGELSLLTYLQELNLHGNNLLGTIPKEIGQLKNLRVLDLGANHLVGRIPPELGNLSSVLKINLESNGLTGTIPPELAMLKYLEELRLCRNRLQGTVLGASNADFRSGTNEMYTSMGNASFCHSSQLKVADFSYNFLTGTVPKCLERFSRTSFRGNCLNEKDIKQRPSSQCDDSSSTAPVKSHTSSSSKHNSPADESKHPGITSKPVWVLVLEIVTGVMVGAIFFIGIFTAYQRWNSKPAMIIPWKKSASDKDRLAVYIDSDLLKDVPSYNRQELEVACEDFSNIIGSSPDSIVYKGIIKGGSEIAVISFCVKEDQWTGYHELYYQREVADLARLDHENTGKLLGYCRESSPFTRMLVFQYTSNGTLSEHLHFGDGCQLSWPRRMKIIVGIARGLKYLHSDLDPPFTMTELSSSSIYLTEDFSPKFSTNWVSSSRVENGLKNWYHLSLIALCDSLKQLVDFESWKTILARSEKNSCSILSNGAICVLPNSIEERHLDEKGNVYAFGVVLLEIVCGRQPYSKEHGNLVDWVKGYLENPEKMANLVDPQLKHFEEDDLKVVCEMVTQCIESDPTKRPSMKEVCSSLESRINLSLSAELRSSSLAWAELALDS